VSDQFGGSVFSQFSRGRAMTTTHERPTEKWRQEEEMCEICAGNVHIYMSADNVSLELETRVENEIVQICMERG
jgi:hypothetical protein